MARIVKSLYSFWKVFLGCCIYFRGLLWARQCRSRKQLNGQSVIITGGNTGIGKETALDLAARGARVIIACRNVNKGNQAAKDILTEVPNADITVKSLDLASFASIRRFAAEILNTEPQINILINNAGLGGCPKSKTEDGFETQFGVNHLGHFLLTNLLLDRIKASAPARIVNVASLSYMFGRIDFSNLNMDRGYHPLLAYCTSKLANILFTRELAKRLEGTGVTTYCLHPGAVNTGLGQYLDHSYNRATRAVYDFTSRLFFLSPKKGAQTTIYCAIDDSIAKESGFYYSDCSEVSVTARARDENVAKKLWEVSEELVGISTST